jgi:YggT family protein
MFPGLESWLRTFAVLLLQILSLAILIRVLLSWFPINPSNPVVRLVFDITEPVLAPFRRVIPTIGMIDLSPLAAILVLNVLADFIRGARGFF